MLFRNTGKYLFFYMDNAACTIMSNFDQYIVRPADSNAIDTVT